MKSDATGTFIFSSFNKYYNHVISQVVCASAWYSASADDLATVCCFFVCQEIKLSLRKMANPVMDRLVVGQEAQYESEKALIPELFDPDEKKNALTL